ncbi:MAG: hypothetical protein HBSAPP01_17310 [Candidatus Brocadia sapporoensis]|nr:hypothetical protein [Candidatus Brocadia sp.]GJQ23941.1 MAG: hypothetical protein HBSAPP01_17310 [Candidatus Brocadia sapporoensis]
MGKQYKWDINDIGDALALKIQTLRKKGKIDDEQPLFRLEYRKEAKKAPFQFDVATAIVHKTGCTAIPDSSEYTLYAMWKLRERVLACEKCRPDLIKKETTMKKDVISDIVYGFLSILEQFGSVLVERGKEYRNSKQGKQVAKTVDNILSELDIRQKKGVKFAMSSLNSLLEIVQEYNDSFNGNGTSNDREVKRNRKGSNGKAKTTVQRKKRRKNMQGKNT